MPQPSGRPQIVSNPEPRSVRLSEEERAEISARMDDILDSASSQKLSAAETIAQLKAIDPDQAADHSTPDPQAVSRELDELTRGGWRTHLPAEMRQEWRETMDRLANRLAAAGPLPPGLRAYAEGLEERIAAEKQADQEQARLSDVGTDDDQLRTDRAERADHDRIGHDDRPKRYDRAGRISQQGGWTR